MIEIRLDDDGTLNEIVAGGASVHLERMTKTRWCLTVEDADGAVTGWIGGKSAPHFERQPKALVPWPARDERPED